MLLPGCSSRGIGRAASTEQCQVLTGLSHLHRRVNLPLVRDLPRVADVRALFQAELVHARRHAGAPRVLEHIMDNGLWKNQLAMC